MIMDYDANNISVRMWCVENIASKKKSLRFTHDALNVGSVACIKKVNS